MNPTVGRIVLYLAYGTPGGEYPAGVPRAAVVTEVDPNRGDGRVSLCVLNPTGIFFPRDVPYGDQPGCWRWPVREDGQT